MDITILGITMNIAFFWIILAVLFALTEALTTNLITIWFVLGGIAAAIASLFTDSVIIQIIVFLAVSIILLLFTRPLLKSKMKIGEEKTNVHALIGRKAVVLKEVTSLEPGEVKINGLIWLAIPEENGKSIDIGKEITIKKVDGVKLIVSEEKKEEKND